MSSYSDYGRCLIGGKVYIISLINTTPEEALRQEQMVQEFLSIEESRREEELEAGIIGFRRQFYRQDRMHWSPDNGCKQGTSMPSSTVNERLNRTRNSIRRRLSRSSWIGRSNKKVNTETMEECIESRASDSHFTSCSTRSRGCGY